MLVFYFYGVRLLSLVIIFGYSSSGWWFEPIWKIVVKLEIFPNFQGKHKKYLKPPASDNLVGLPQKESFQDSTMTSAKKTSLSGKTMGKESVFGGFVSESCVTTINQSLNIWSFNLL